MGLQAKNTQLTIAVHDSIAVAWASTRLCHLTPKITKKSERSAETHRLLLTCTCIMFNSKYTSSDSTIGLTYRPPLSFLLVFEFHSCIGLTQRKNHILQETGGVFYRKVQQSLPEQRSLSFSSSSLELEESSKIQHHCGITPVAIAGHGIRNENSRVH